MLKKILKEISKDEKMNFLNKLQSGDYTLKKPCDPKEKETFVRIENGLYRSNETGKVMSREQINNLEDDYFLILELVSNRNLIPDEIELMPYPVENYLQSLLTLKNKKDVKESK